MKKHILQLILVLLFLTSCNNKQVTEEIKCSDYSPNAMEQANWFLGTWQNNSPEGNYTETWIQNNDSLYTGKSFVTINNDTVFYESIRLEKKSTDWNYSVSVENQNAEKSVAFKLTSITPHQLIFENLQHDFPTKIIYTKITNDSIVAEITGVLNNKQKTESFPMKKVK